MRFLGQYFSDFNVCMNQLGTLLNADIDSVGLSMACDSVLLTESQMMTMQDSREVRQNNKNKLCINCSVFSRDMCYGE